MDTETQAHKTPHNTLNAPDTQDKYDRRTLHVMSGYKSVGTFGAYSDIILHTLDIAALACTLRGLSHVKHTPYRR